jgi:tight adherence protein B
MNLGPLIVAALCMVSVIVLFIGLGGIVGGGTDAITRRLDRYTLRNAPAANAAGAKDARTQGKLTTEIDKELVRRGKSVDMTQELARADLKLTPAEFLMINVIVMLLFGILGYLVFRQAFMAVPAMIGGYFVPRLYMRMRQGNRRKAFAAQLPDAIGLLANSLRSGYSLAQSMELLSREMPPPIAGEFGRVVREIGLGLAFEQAMDNLVRRNKNDDLDLTVTAILVNHEVGGNLSQVLEIIGHTVRERIRIKGEISVLTAQQRSAGYLVGSMPFVLTVVLFIMNPDYMGELFRSLCGYMLACTSFGLVALAFILISKIVNIEV